MKSYLRFLSRNKLYTAIEVVGLSVSLAFIILMSAYVIGNMSYDRMIKDKDGIYLCHNVGYATSYSFLEDEFTMYPEIRECCQFGSAPIGIFVEGELAQDCNPLWVTDNFFTFLQFKLVEGDPHEVLKKDFSAVVSESFAERYFSGEHPIGSSIEVDYDGTKRFLTVTGVFKDVKKSNILNSDVLVNQRLVPSIGNGGWYECVNLVRFSGNPDRSQLAHDIYYNSKDEFFASRLVPELRFTRYDELDINIGVTYPFQNIGDLKQQKRFTSACVILLIFSLLNYMFLTLAFSRFRIKEMATRMLLGTTRTSIIRRLITESLLLTTFSFAIGALMAVALEKQVSLLLRSEVDVFSNSAEMIWGAVIIILCSVIAGSVPALNMATVKPIEVLKGESRKKDKMVLGSIFIAIQTGICIMIISIASAMYLQTRKMIDEPLGYTTEGLIEVEDMYNDVDMYNIVKALPCVKRVSRYSSCPITYSHARWSLGLYGHDVMIHGYGLKCDMEALSMLGIDIIEKYDNNMEMFFTQSSYETIASMFESNGVEKDDMKHVYAGIVSDFRFGNAATVLDGVTCVSISEGQRIGWLLIEAEGDAVEAKKMIAKAFKEAMGDRFCSPEPVRMVREIVEESFTSEKHSCLIIGAFSLLCILLTIMALTALSGYYAHMRTQDTAVRKVFGISSGDVFWKTVWGFIAPVLIGSIAAAPLAYTYVAHWLETYPVRIVNSPVIYLAALAIVLLVTLATVTLQAIRLMRTNPADALKKE